MSPEQRRAIKVARAIYLVACSLALVGVLVVIVYAIVDDWDPAYLYLLALPVAWVWIGGMILREVVNSIRTDLPAKDLDAPEPEPTMKAKSLDRGDVIEWKHVVTIEGEQDDLGVFEQHHGVEFSASNPTAMRQHQQDEVDRGRLTAAQAAESATIERDADRVLYDTYPAAWDALRLERAGELPPLPRVIETSTGPMLVVEQPDGTLRAVTTPSDIIVPEDSYWDGDVIEHDVDPTLRFGPDYGSITDRSPVEPNGYEDDWGAASPTTATPQRRVSALAQERERFTRARIAEAFDVPADLLPDSGIGDLLVNESARVWIRIDPSLGTIGVDRPIRVEDEDGNEIVGKIMFDTARNRYGPFVISEF